MFQGEAQNLREMLERDLARDPGILILAYPYARTWREIEPGQVERAWASVNPKEATAAYLHIPFCHRKCSFCDFLAYYGRPGEEVERYVDLLVQEIEIARRRLGWKAIASVHFGGGTPSLLSALQIARILSSLRGSFGLKPAAEISLEVFPDSHVTTDLLAGLREVGVNRLSLGIQFFDDDLKKSLHRTDWSSENERVLGATQEAGFENFNIDLMCGMPEQTEASWQASVLRTLAFSPSHICIFPVSVRHPGIPLFRKPGSLPPPDRTRAMYDFAASVLQGAGYIRTTRHNFVRPSFEYRYERLIAELAPLIGLGANSISYAHDLIYRNHSDLARYAAGIEAGGLPVCAAHSFPPEERPNNYVVRRLEYLHLDGSDFQRVFSQRLDEVFENEIAILEEKGLAERIKNDLHLTEDGIYYTAAVKRCFFHSSARERLREMDPKGLSIERGLLPAS